MSSSQISPRLADFLRPIHKEMPYWHCDIGDAIMLISVFAGSQVQFVTARVAHSDCGRVCNLLRFRRLAWYPCLPIKHILRFDDLLLMCHRRLGPNLADFKLTFGGTMISYLSKNPSNAIF